MRLLIADDHDLVREMLATYLSGDPSITVDTASTLPEALALARQASYDAVLLDYNMPGMEGLSGLVRMIALRPGPRVALLSGAVGEGVARRALEAGAAGYLPKTLAPEEFSAAVREIAAGGIFVPPVLAGRGMAAPAGERLSRREYEVLERLARGLSNKEIARALDLAEPTVKLHVKTLCRKIGAANRTQAAMIARDRGLV